MIRLFSFLRRRGQRGQSLVEYAVIIAFVCIVALVGLTALGTKTNSKLLAPAASLLP
jgi:Flp pilus assembly pilin Flp